MGQGKKYDAGKLRMELLPPEALRQAAASFSYGAEKYGPDNYKSHDLEDGIARHHAALLRHLTAWQQGEARDPDSGLHHLAGVLANAMMITWAEANLRPDDFTETWNRPPASGESVHGEKFISLGSRGLKELRCGLTADGKSPVGGNDREDDRP